MKSRLDEIIVLQHENVLAKKEYTVSKSVYQRKEKNRQMKENLKAKCFVRQTTGSKQITKVYSQFFDNLNTLCPLSTSVSDGQGNNKGLVNNSASSSSAASAASSALSSSSSVCKQSASSTL